MSASQHQKSTVNEPLSRRDLIMSTAEELFARKGIDSVSLNEINKAAGQRNTSALHYHFGSKDGLVEAIVYLHYETIDVALNQRLDELEASRPFTLRQLVVASISPFVEQLDDRRGINYLRIVTQLLNKSANMITKGHPQNEDRARLRVFRLYNEVCKDLPIPVLRSRSLLFSSMLFHSLASFAQLNELGEVNPLGSRALFFNNLVDSIEGLMKAPASPDTSAVLSG
jgi:AcrR family transcriptional regulator